MNVLCKCLFTAAVLLNMSTAIACTDFRLKAEDGSLMISRSMEFGVPLNSNLRTSPRGRTVNTQTTNQKPGLSWTSKYGYAYVDGFGIDASFDGLNEKGLSFGYLYLPGETRYQDIPEGQDGKAIPYTRFGDWVLGNFQTVDEVRAALENVYVSGEKLPQLGDAVLPAHASIYDASGKGIVVEFYNNKVNVFDNIGVMTNSPKYDWHVTNLRNFINLSAENPKSITQGGITYTGNGLGSGAIGLPGDASPPSRFVKVAFMAANAFHAKNADELLNLAQHIMNNVDLPAGYVRSTENGEVQTDTTQWVVFKDIGNRKIYFRTYDDLSLRSIDLNQLDFSEKARPLSLKLNGRQKVTDETARLKASPTS